MPLSFIVSLLTLVGMFVMIFYTGCGLRPQLPVGLIAGSLSTSQERSQRGGPVRFPWTRRIDTLRNKLRGSMGGCRHSTEAERLLALEEERRSLDERQRRLEHRQGTVAYRLRCLLRPVQIAVGCGGMLLGLLVWLSLLLVSIDKALHSLGYKMGYLLPKASLPNPLDMVSCSEPEGVSHRLCPLLGCGPVPCHVHGVWHPENGHLVRLSQNVPHPSRQDQATGDPAALPQPHVCGAGSKRAAVQRLPAVHHLRQPALPLTGPEQHSSPQPYAVHHRRSSGGLCHDPGERTAAAVLLQGLGVRRLLLLGYRAPLRELRGGARGGDCARPTVGRGGRHRRPRRQRRREPPPRLVPGASIRVAVDPVGVYRVSSNYWRLLQCLGRVSDGCICCVLESGPPISS
uniref:Putative lysosomal cobalamin transporter n=2 Tax=Ixodes ricinus TaxID=34613 RepID=A0A090X8J1_IXORI